MKWILSKTNMEKIENNVFSKNNEK